MKYYTIQENDNILTANNKQALTRFYENVYELPEDYQEGKYIVGEKEVEIEVPDFEIVDVEVEIHDTDEDGNYIYDKDGNPITHTETRPIQEPVMIEYEDVETVIDYDKEGNPTGSHEITVIKKKQSTHKETKTVKVLVLNPDWEQKQADRREKEFNKAFFNTSLGYIRRSVTMQDGSKKDFLSDLVLSIKAGLEQGLDVEILAYDKPPFDRDIEDWTVYQHSVPATPQFIMECLMQTANDFLPINED